jgi:hypothetical protein
MKKKITLLILFALTCIGGWAQSISIISIPTSTQVGNNLVVNYKYTASASTGKTTIAVTKNGGANPWDYISTVAYLELNPAVAGTDVAGTFTVPIPGGTTLTSALTGNENYRVTLELKNSSNGWLAGDYSTVDYNFTSAAVTPAISITSIPSSTQAGTNLVLNYKYTAASAGKTTIAVTKNGGTNPWDFISTVAYIELEPAVAGTDVAGSFTVPIAALTTPTSALTGNENYRVTLELKNASNVWLAGDYSTVGYNFTPAVHSWVGSLSSDWANAANWNIGVPNSTSNITIASGAIFQPEISSNVNVNSLTINSGATLAVNPAKVLTVTGAVTNSGDLILKSSASGTASLLCSSAVANVTQQHYLSSNQRGWRLIGNPLSSTTFGTLAANSTTPVVLGNNASGAYVSSTNTWNNSGDTDSMPSKTAYKIFVRGRASEVTGTVYSQNPPSNVTLSIKGTASNAAPASISTTAGKYYLVANPYTASVSVRSILDASTGLSNTVSYYNPTNGSNGSTDLILKKGGFTNISITAGVQGDVNDVVIPPMGAIFVQASSNGAVNVPLTAIFTGNALGGGYNHKLAQSKKTSSKVIKLEVASNGTYFDSASLYFKTDSELGTNVDFGKLPNTILDFYSITKGLNMAVAELDLKEQNIPFGITSTIHGNYTIKVTENSIPLGYEAKLLDNLTGVTTILTNGSTYSFDVDSIVKSQGDARFVINLNTLETLSVAGVDLESKIQLWPNPAKGQFNISNSQSAADGNAEIEISTMNGKMIHAQKSASGSTTIIQANGWAAGVYFLKATTNKSQTIKKLIIQ